MPIVDISGVGRIPDIQGFMDVPPELLRAARSALGLSQKDVAKLSRTSPRTIHRIEQNDNVRLDTLRQVQEAFETLGVRFLSATEGGGPGIRIPRESVARKDLRF
jgi:transcriptional regulator with XRE-family HTH domain